jgi:hypothetical protein
MHKNNAYNDEIIRKVEQDLDIYSMGTHTRLKAIKRHKINMPVKPKH